MILIVQNEACEGPGTLASHLSSHALPFKVLRLFERRISPPTLAGASHLVVLGGPMNVYQEEEFPFLKTECHLLEQAVRSDLPMLGICLGAQLLARVLGAKVTKAPVPEIGWYDVELTAEGKSDPALSTLGEKLRVFQWHGDTFEVPQGAVLLARSETCANQAFRYGRNVYALQFHIEVDGDMIGEWFEEYEPLSDARIRAVQEYQRISPVLAAQARRFYDGFFQR